MEVASFTLVDEGKAQEEVAILESKEYSDQKKIYEEGLRKYVLRPGLQYNEKQTSLARNI